MRLYTCDKAGRASPPWQVSREIKTFIKYWESGTLNGRNFLNHTVVDGMVLTVYLDSVGIPTVGCGHRVWPDDHLSVGDEITLARANALFEADIKQIAQSLRNKISVPLFQYEYDACVSLAFNCGPGAAARQLAYQLNKGNYSEMPAYIRGFRTSKYHASRRLAESNIFRRGIYDATH